MTESYENKARPRILQENDKFNKLLTQTNGSAKYSRWIKQHVYWINFILLWRFYFNVKLHLSDTYNWTHEAQFQIL